jgi:hypothetical protein
MAAARSMRGSSSIAFRVSKKSLRSAGAIQPHYVFPTRLSKRNLEYGIDIVLGWTDGELKKGADVECYARIRLRENTVVSSRRIVTVARDVVP